MAKAILGPHVATISGTIGGITYVPLNGQQILRRKAHRARRSKGQNAQPQVIRRAAAYWRMVQVDPAKLALYNALPHIPGLGSYQLAVRDYCHAPVVEEIDVSALTGRAGDPIRVKARDDTAVKEVRVRVLDMNGNLVEEGQAEAGLEACIWCYRMTATLTSVQCISVCATAQDHPGNVGTKSCLAYIR